MTLTLVFLFVFINALASGNNPNKISNLVETRVNEIKQLEKQVNFVERARESLFKTMSLMGTPRRKQ
ncbi:hypothetical protein AX774_g7353 [Zancudomyces culisetae]|uniref:Uncharacterized protein n=1 Tax=Zancudomyces culisetae TaxID=1213189 RepID=A0A1R1PE16_ZANCU|nr:hypothetical protein AX774_g7353 [Zancudomyces culisetae]|eukprot:OMH79240.1 hypothetical protein AX774_g7353 [Zancudomyces culisetae]